MRKLILVLSFLITLSTPIYAQEQCILGMVSPKLREFLATHQQAFQAFSNTTWECFSNRTLEIYYFYSDAKYRPDATHYYSSPTNVVMTIRENQEPLDEFICFIYEAKNSLNQQRFEAIFEEARTGKITKNEYAYKFDRIEFEASLVTKELLAKLKFSKREISKSRKYKAMMETSNKYEDRLSNLRNGSPLHHTYRQLKISDDYDLLRQQKNPIAQ